MSRIELDGFKTAQNLQRGYPLSAGSRLAVLHCPYDGEEGIAWRCGFLLGWITPDKNQTLAFAA